MRNTNIPNWGKLAYTDFILQKKIFQNINLQCFYLMKYVVKIYTEIIIVSITVLNECKIYLQTAIYIINIYVKVSVFQYLLNKKM